MVNETAWTIEGKTILITGANSGIGKETARTLLRMGAKRLIMACRNVFAAEEAAAEIKKELGLGDSAILVRELNLANLNSIRSFAKKFISEEPELHVLINNAGIIGPNSRKISDDGFESNFATNHLGHFLLTNLLMETLKKSAPSRVVVVASDAYLYSWPWGINFDDVQIERSYFNDWVAYGRSKLANILFARRLHQNLVASGTKDVSVFSLHPGVISTNLFRSRPWHIRLLMKPLSKFILLTPEKGADTTIYCATASGIECHSGGYFKSSQFCQPWSALVTDDDAAKKLWEISEKLCSPMKI